MPTGQYTDIYCDPSPDDSFKASPAQWSGPETQSLVDKLSRQVNVNTNPNLPVHRVQVGVSNGNSTGGCACFDNTESASPYPTHNALLPPLPSHLHPMSS